MKKYILLSLLALAAISACQQEDEGDGASQLSTLNFQLSTKETRAITGNANPITLRLDDKEYNYILNAAGKLTPVGDDQKLYIVPGTPAIALYAYGTVNYKLQGITDAVAMPVVHAPVSTPVIWDGSPGVSLTLQAASALVRLQVLGDGGITAATMPGAEIPKMADALYQWRSASHPSLVPVEDATATFASDGLLQIMPGTGIAAGDVLVTINGQSIRAMQAYTFLGGMEYTLSVIINSQGEASLQGVSIAPLGQGAGLGNLEQEVRIIATIDDLRRFRDDVNKGGDNRYLRALQVADIEMEEQDKTGEGWKTIGNLTHEFCGTYNGGGYTISGLTINRGGEDGDSYQGLFGSTYGAILTGIHLRQVKVAGKGTTGALVGSAMRSYISRCSATGQGVTGTANNIGGLVGANTDGYITYCYAQVPVTGVQYVGGLVGKNNSSEANYPVVITACYATGNVSGTNYVGGLIGQNSDRVTIAFSYATGSVNTTTTSGSTGGLVGDNAAATINSCYATGKVTGGNNRGSLVGYTGGIVTYSHAPIGNGSATGLIGYGTDDGTCSTTAGKAGQTVRGDSPAPTRPNAVTTKLSPNNDITIDYTIWGTGTEPKFTLQW